MCQYINHFEIYNSSKPKLDKSLLLYYIGKFSEKIYKEFTKKIYNWSRDGEQRKYLICALMIYVYLTRNEEK